MGATRINTELLEALKSALPTLRLAATAEARTNKRLRAARLGGVQFEDAQARLAKAEAAIANATKGL